MKNKMYVECVGYAFWQCYDNGIAIARYNDEASDEVMLQELQLLVEEYNMALEVCEETIFNWELPAEVIDRVLQARTLDECYKKQP